MYQPTVGTPTNSWNQLPINPLFSIYIIYHLYQSHGPILVDSNLSKPPTVGTYSEWFFSVRNSRAASLSISPFSAAFPDVFAQTPLGSIFFSGGGIPNKNLKSKKHTWMFPKMGGKPPKMDGLYWKTLLKWMTWKYHPSLKLTVRPWK